MHVGSLWPPLSNNARHIQFWAALLCLSSPLIQRLAAAGGSDLLAELEGLSQGQPDTLSTHHTGRSPPCNGSHASAARPGLAILLLLLQGLQPRLHSQQGRQPLQVGVPRRSLAVSGFPRTARATRCGTWHVHARLQGRDQAQRLGRPAAGCQTAKIGAEGRAITRAINALQAVEGVQALGTCISLPLGLSGTFRPSSAPLGPCSLYWQNLMGVATSSSILLSTACSSRLPSFASCWYTFLGAETAWMSHPATLSLAGGKTG